MNKFLTKSIVPPIALASILSAGFMFVWLAATLALFALVAPILFDSQPSALDDKTAPFGWLMVIYLLSPLFSAVLLFGIGPLVEMERYRAHPEMLDLAWLTNYRLPMLTLCAFSALVAIYFYRRHRLTVGRGALAWAIFIFVWGLPGVVGYLLHRNWPTTEECQKCGRVSPRDRDACLHCGTAFPPPATKGIEIFA
jgi:hypothetical protein